MPIEAFEPWVKPPIEPRVEPRAVLAFWFSDRARPLWFEKDSGFDAEIRERFGAAIDHAIAGGFEDWRRDKDGALALLILLDQMTRNIFRGDPRSFAGDRRALAVAEQAVALGFDRDFPFSARRFFYIPFEHSEDPAHQDRSLALFTMLTGLAPGEAREDAAGFTMLTVLAPGEAREDAAGQMEAALRHHEIIRRFGRFPHRNAVLGRQSTPEEVEFLTEPNSTF